MQTLDRPDNATNSSVSIRLNILPLQVTKAVVNLSDISLNDATIWALDKGMSSSVLPTEDILGGVDEAVSTFPLKLQRMSVKKLYESSKRPGNRTTKAGPRSWLPPQTLLGNADLTVPPANKSSVTVLPNNSDYKEKVLALFDDPAYKKLAKDRTQSPGRKTTLVIKRS
jgi:hypothetical protein